MRSKAVSALKRFRNPRAERMRLRARYRDAVLRCGVRFKSPGGLRAMRKLVGPDCAYHLYRGFSGGEK
jgi:hypothetical protein